MNGSGRLSCFFLILAACAVRGERVGPSPSVPATEDTQVGYRELLDDLRTFWLDRDTVPAPVLSYAPQTRADRGLVLTVAPDLPEAQAWNVWPDGTARLFNDAVGYLWRVHLSSDRPVRWLPAHTQLAVNVTEQTFAPASAPDDLLLPLLRGAAIETRAGRPPDLALRMRNADEFRRAYLGTDATTGAREGVLVFPAPSGNLQTVAMELTLGLWVEGEGLRQYRFLFE